MAIFLMVLCSMQAVISTDVNAFDTGTGANDRVDILAVQADGKVILGGAFTSINGMTRIRIARLNTNGSVDTSFDPGAGANFLVTALAIQADGKVLLGGAFTSINGITRNRIARLNTDGSVDTSFDPGTGANSWVFDLAVQADGKVLLVGRFTSINGIPRNGIARLNTDGSVDTSFDPGTGANNDVRDLALQADGKVLLGGFFTSINGIPRNYVARLNTDGSVDASFDTGIGANRPVYTLALQADGKVLMGGLFDSFNGIPRRIARLNTGGSLDTSFDPGRDGMAIALLAIQADGKVLVEGSFSINNDITRDSIVRLNTDGSVDLSFDSGSGAGSFGVTLALQADGKLLVGGDFQSINGIPRNRIARLNTNGSVDGASIPLNQERNDFLLMVLPAIIAANNGIAGTYSGTMRYTIITSPGSSVSGSDRIEIRVNEDRTIVVNPGTTYPGSGTISGNIVKIFYPAQNFNLPPQVSCSGTVKGEGTLSGNKITGTLGPSAFTCNGNVLSLTGTFAGTKKY